MTNPYRWQHDHPQHAVPRQVALEDLHGHVRRGLAIRLVGGRGMGKSVLLRQLESRLGGDPGTRVVRVPSPPADATLVGLVHDLADRLGLAPLPRDTLGAFMDAVAASGTDRLVILLDEADQYVQLDPTGHVARAWFNQLEAMRKERQDRLAIVVAGGLGLLHLSHVLGSGLVSRAESVLLSPFDLDDLSILAEPLAERGGHALDREVLHTLAALSGGNPALATFALEHLWAEPAGEPPAPPVRRDAVGKPRLLGARRARRHPQPPAAFNEGPAKWHLEGATLPLQNPFPA